MYWVLESTSDKKIYGGGGFAVVRLNNENYCTVEKIHFLPRARGHGYGRKLLETILINAIKKSCTTTVLGTANFLTDTNRLYKRIGFQQEFLPADQTPQYAVYYRLNLRQWLNQKIRNLGQHILNINLEKTIEIRVYGFFKKQLTFRDYLLHLSDDRKKAEIVEALTDPDTTTQKLKEILGHHRDLLGVGKTTGENLLDTYLQLVH